MQETLQVFKGVGKYSRKRWKFATLSEDKSPVFNPKALCRVVFFFFKFLYKFQVKFLDAYLLYILMSTFAKDFFSFFFKQRHKSLKPLHNSSGYWSDMLFLYFEKYQCSNNQQEQEYWTSKYGTLCSQAITVPIKYANQAAPYRFFSLHHFIGICVRGWVYSKLLWVKSFFPLVFVVITKMLIVISDRSSTGTAS